MEENYTTLDLTTGGSFIGEPKTPDDSNRSSEYLIPDNDPVQIEEDPPLQNNPNTTLAPIIMHPKDNSKTAHIFVLTTMAEALFQAGILAYDLAQYPLQTVPHAFAYLTVWQLVLLAFTSFLALGQLANVYWSTRKKSPERRIDEIIHLKNQPSGWRSLSFCVAMLSTVLFWSILSSTSDNLGMSFMFHGLGFLIAFAMIAINRLRVTDGLYNKKSTDEPKATGVKGFFQSHDLLRNVLFTSIYAGFAVGFTLGGLKNTEGAPYIYKVLDWNADPSTAALYTGIGIVGMAAVTFIASFIEKQTHHVYDHCAGQQALPAT